MNILKRIILIGCLLLPLSLYAEKGKDVILCTWNIGHFSNGSKPHSLIDINNYQKSLELYKSFIYNDICPNVITLNEYNCVFCGEDNVHNPYQTSSMLFNGFTEEIIGPKCWGICNAIFSNNRLARSRVIYFESQKSIVGDDIVKSRENYFIECDLYIRGKKVKLVSLHLLFSSKVKEIFQQNQIEELINRYKKTDRVILCGDWNTQIYSSLKNAGYELANDGSLRTFPSKGYALDNIAAKGLQILDVRMIKTSLSDHYPLICKLSLKE